MEKKIIGVFETEESAIEAIKRLKGSGYEDDEISVLAKDKDDLDRIKDETDAHVEDQQAGGAIGGAVAGGILGGAGALLLELGVFAIPGVGPFLAAGPIAVTLAGIIAGGAVGGVVGALIDLGFSETEAKEYKSYLDDGNILVLVDKKENEDEVYNNFSENQSLTRHKYEDMNRRRDENLHKEVNADVNKVRDGNLDREINEDMKKVRNENIDEEVNDDMTRKKGANFDAGIHDDPVRDEEVDKEISEEMMIRRNEDLKRNQNPGRKEEINRERYREGLEKDTQKHRG